MPIFKKAPAQAAVPTLEQELNGAHAQAAAAQRQPLPTCTRQR